MKALILSDIHSNQEALTTVIDDANGEGGFDELWALGDLVGYGPDPAACIELLRQQDAQLCGWQPRPGGFRQVGP